VKSQIWVQFGRKSQYKYVSTVFVIFVQNVPEDGFSVLQGEHLQPVFAIANEVKQPGKVLITGLLRQGS